MKTGISDHFQFFFCYKYIAEKEDVKKEFKYKHKFSNQAIGTFKLRLCYINWSKVRQYRKVNEVDSNYFNFIDSLYGECFLEAKIRLKEKKNFTPWIATGIKKSSKGKTKLYEKFLNHRTILNEEKYKTCKNLFEPIKQKSKKSYFLKTFRSKYYSTKII